MTANKQTHEMNILCISGCKQARYENNLITYHALGDSLCWRLLCARQAVLAQIALMKLHYCVSSVINRAPLFDGGKNKRWQR